jgi:hypothetical protein
MNIEELNAEIIKINSAILEYTTKAEALCETNKNLKQDNKVAKENIIKLYK